MSDLTTDQQLLKNIMDECAKFEMLFKKFGACEQLYNTANEMSTDRIDILGTYNRFHVTSDHRISKLFIQYISNIC